MKNADFSLCSVVIKSASSSSAVRFFKSMKNDRSKLLIPCYRDMDVYDLPNEFAHLQAQDMGKIGFITDVIRGLKKVFNRDEQPQQPKRFKFAIKRPKKPSKIKPILDKWKQKIKERAKYCLKFSKPTFSAIFFAVCVILSIYFLCVEPYLLEDCTASSVFVLFGSIVPLLIFIRFIKKEITAVISQAIISLIITLFYYFIIICFKIKIHIT